LLTSLFRALACTPIFAPAPCSCGGLECHSCLRLPPAGKGSYYNKAVECQFVGEWSAGSFVKGHWVLKDGSMFQGSFADGVNPVRAQAGVFTTL
jgi:hypothetical protein